MRNFLTFISKWEKFFPAGICVLIFLLFLPHVMLSDYLQRDVATRYAPMAEAFAAGNWQYAFHPRIQTLHPLISGCFTAVSGCSGFVGTQLSGLLFLGLCAFPLYRLLKLIFDQETAVWGTLLLPLMSPVIQISISGLRESHKTFALLLISLGILTVFKFREKYSGYLLTGIGAGLTFCIRNDLVFPALCLMTAAGAMEFAALKSFKRSCAGLACLLSLFAFETAINYFVSGYAIPGSRFWLFFSKISPKTATPMGLFLYIVLPSLVLYFIFSAAGGFLLRSRKGRKALVILGILLPAAFAVDIILQSLSVVILNWKDGIKIFSSLIRPIFTGCDPPLFILAVFGICSLKKQQKWDAGQQFLLILFFFWIVSIISPIIVIERKLYVSDRYLLPASLLLTGWGIRGIIFCTGRLQEYLSIPVWKKTRRILFIILPCMCLFHAYSNVLESRFEREKIIQLKSLNIISSVIRKNYRGPKFFKPDFALFEYRSGRRPGIAFIPLKKQSVAAYWSGGSIISLDQNPDFIVASAEQDLSGPKWQKIAENIPFGKQKLNVWELKKTK